MNGQKEAKKFQPNGNTWQVAYICVRACVCLELVRAAATWRSWSSPLSGLKFMPSRSPCLSHRKGCMDFDAWSIDIRSKAKVHHTHGSIAKLQAAGDWSVIDPIPIGYIQAPARRALSPSIHLSRTTAHTTTPSSFEGDGSCPPAGSDRDRRSGAMPCSA